MVPDLGPSPGAWSNSYLALEGLVDPHSNGGALYAGEVTVAKFRLFSPCTPLSFALGLLVVGRLH